MLENEKGVKDVRKVKEFVANAKNVKTNGGSIWIF